MLFISMKIVHVCVLCMRMCMHAYVYTLHSCVYVCVCAEHACVGEDFPQTYSKNPQNLNCSHVQQQFHKIASRYHMF